MAEHSGFISMDDMPMPQSEHGNAMHMGGEHVVEQRASAVAEIERRRAACKDIGVQLTPDVDGWQEARQLHTLRVKNQACFLYSVANVRQNPRSHEPKICILNFFKDRNEAKKWYVAHQDDYDRFGTVFVDQCLGHDLVLCADQARQTDAKYKHDVAKDILGRHLESLAKRRDRFEQGVKDPSTRDKPLSVDEVNATRLMAPGIGKKKVSSRVAAMRALQNKRAKDAKVQSEATVVDDGAQEVQALSRDCRHDVHRFAVVSIVPDNRPGVHEPEPWVRVYAGFEDEAKASEYIEKRAKDVVQNLHLDVVEMYTFPHESFQKPPKDVEQTRYRNAEMDKIMHAPELVRKDIEKYERHCREERNTEPEVVEIGVPAAGDMPKHSMTEYSNHAEHPDNKVKVENLQTLDWNDYKDRKDSMMVVKDGQVTDEVENMMRERQSSELCEPDDSEHFERIKDDANAKRERARQRLRQWAKKSQT